MFNASKYTTWYHAIIAKAQARQLPMKAYYETHHVTPRSLGGSDRRENLVKLTAKEHYVAHLLLMKMCVDSVDRQKMASAFLYMSEVRNQYTQQRYTSRLYEHHKKIRASILRDQMTGEGNPRYGCKVTDETRGRISQGRKGVNTNTPEGLEKKRKRFLANNPMSDLELAAKAAHNHSKSYEVTWPDGKVEIVKNMAEFCRQHNLHKGNMCSVAKGNLKQYKGFRCSYV